MKIELLKLEKNGRSGKSKTKALDQDLSGARSLVVFVKKGEKNSLLQPSNLSESSIESLIHSSHKEGVIQGKLKECTFFRSVNFSSYQHLLVVGLGESGYSSENIRSVGASIYHAAKAQKLKHLCIQGDFLLQQRKDGPALIQALTEGLKLATYEFTEHKSKVSSESERSQKNNGKMGQDNTGPEKVVLELSQLSKEIEQSLSQAIIVADSTNFCRWLGDHSANTMTPSVLAQTVVKKAKGTSVQVTVWDKEKIKKEGFGGLYSVSQGSSEDPRFIIMKYQGAANKKDVVYFVGKGLTFDSGGISIKPSASMDEMKYDMCGGAAVIASVFAMAQLNLKVNVVGLIPATENMPGPSATKPGDIMTARNGKTVEILNTDAEGRLVLADALSYASEHKPKVIFNVATLTGAIVVALGNTHTGVFTRDQKLLDQIESAAETTGELVWPLPVTDSHVDDMKGLHADWSNISSQKGAGSSTAAAFLEQFVGEGIPFAHFDIAGTAWNVANRLNYAPKKGASGVMVRTFIELAQRQFDL
ncbi:MAG: leucyl aminopeptidase [Bdellovibrionales bacterium]|nr:leucyl aminopeptidase [Bdellovibrionales bacterium]